MLVKIVLFLGIALVALAGGAAGYQALKDQGYDVAAFFGGGDESPADAPEAVTPTAAAADAPLPEPAQNWLISPTGGLVEKDVVAAFLHQDRFVKSRTMSLRVTLPLESLLSSGEQLPGDAFLAAFAEVRGHVAAEVQCTALKRSIAADCAMVSVHALADTLSPTQKTIGFEMTVAFTQKPGPDDLPDLSTVVLLEQPKLLQSKDAAAQFGMTPSPDDVAWMADVFTTNCRQENRGEECRLLSMTMEMEAEGPAFRASLGVLAPLPPGLYPAPPLN